MTMVIKQVCLLDKVYRQPLKRVKKTRLMAILGFGKTKPGFTTQDRRGHLKAPNIGQRCCQISEFYRSFSQLSVCRHRDYRGLYFAA